MQMLLYESEGVTEWCEPQSWNKISHTHTADSSYVQNFYNIYCFLSSRQTHFPSWLIQSTSA